MSVDIASGRVHSELADLRVPGHIDLIWERIYAAALVTRSNTLLGPGWNTPYAMTLTRHPGGFEFLSASGSAELVPDPHGMVEAGEAVQSQGAFLEIFMRERSYVVRRWNFDGAGPIRQYVFVPGIEGVPLRLSSLEEVGGGTLDLAWSPEGQLLCVRQRLEGRELRPAYNQQGCVVALTLVGAAGDTLRAVRYDYDARGRLAEAMDAAGFADRYEYDAAGRMSREIAKDGGIFHYRYDENDRCLQRTGLNHYDEKRLRYLVAASITEVTDSLGATRRYNYRADGQITLEWDPLGACTATDYDEFGRIVERRDPMGATTRYSYDADGNRSCVVDPLGNSSAFTYTRNHQLATAIDRNGQSWHRLYDDLDRLLVMVDPHGERWRFTRNRDGQITEIVNPLGATKRQVFLAGVLQEVTDWLGNPIHLVHDSFGRLLESVGPLGDATRYDRDVLGRAIQVFQPDGSVLRAAYDHAGNMTHFVDGNEKVTRWRYGPCSRLIERIDAEGGRVQYVWGTEPDRLHQFINEKGERYSFVRDEAGNIVVERSFDGSERSYRYNACGEVVRWTNAEGQTADITRNALQQVVGISTSSGETLAYGFDPEGRLHDATSAAHFVQFERDALGRIVVERQGVDWVETQYDALGTQRVDTSSRGHSVHHDVDANGNLLRLCVDGFEALAFERNAYGQTLTASLPGRVLVRQSFDPMGRLLKQHAGLTGSLSSGAKTLLDRSYHYDANGNITRIDDPMRGAEQFAYDPAERLIEMLDSSGAHERFEYDAASNLTRIQREDAGMRDATMPRGPGNKLLKQGDVGFEHDKVGRRITRIEADGGRWTYRWNALDQLTALERPDGRAWGYRYDALGRRISTVEISDAAATAKRYVWNKDVLIQEIGHDESICEWILDPTSFTVLATVQRGQLFSVLSDHLGTPLELIDSTGNSSWSRRQTAWGEIDSVSSNAAAPRNPWSFAGQWRDDESGLHYNYFRYYDPATGSYISPDPVQFRGGLNFYQYAINPTNWIDPYGLICPSNKNRGKGYVVYHIKDKNGKVVYVGITAADRFDQRQQEHTDSGRLSRGRTMEQAKSVSTYGEARGFEQAHIEHYETRNTAMIGKNDPADFKKDPSNRINSYDTSRTDARANAYNKSYATATQEFQ